MSLSVDREGLHFGTAFAGAGEVYFGDHYGWSFVADAQAGETLAWPKLLRQMLAGWADVRVVADGAELFRGRVVFDDTDQEFDLIDPWTGLRLVVDKWGLLQRPFEGREEAVGELADEALDILRILREECGLACWIAFGTLLGAVRDGTAIGHDSDIDLSYLSEKATPMEMTLELWSILRALRAAGKRAVLKSGSFLTVEVTTSDGARVGVDVYATFFLDGWFYETATVRARLDRSALLPLGEVEFAGRRMPAPADPARLLEVSYGPGWRVPDPGFHYDTPPEVTRRFGGWFSTLWSGRREWKAYNTAIRDRRPAHSAFAEWVADRVPAGSHIVEVGGGAGVDAEWLRDRGYDVVMLDYAIVGRRRGEGLRRLPLNLRDTRDVLVRGASLARSPEPSTLVARHLVEVLDAECRDNLFRMAGAALRRGGRLHLELVSVERVGPWSHDGVGGRTWPVTPADVAALASRHGGRVLATESAPPLAWGRRTAPSWRMTLDWPARDGRKESVA